MSITKKIVIIGLVLALAACNNSGPFGGGGDSAGAGSGAIVPGSANDPTSPLFFTQTIGDRVLFVVNEAQLTPEAESILDSQAQWLATNTDFTAIIEGHADEQGTREYNLALGARRADAARAYLISQGVQAGRLQVVSYGKERPIEVCSNEACYAKNRRAVTVLAGGLTG